MCSLSSLMMFREKCAHYISANTVNVSSSPPRVSFPDNSGHFRCKENKVRLPGKSQGPRFLECRTFYWHLLSDHRFFNKLKKSLIL
jgi:hypothetical protein